MDREEAVRNEAYEAYSAFTNREGTSAAYEGDEDETLEGYIHYMANPVKTSRLFSADKHQLNEEDLKRMKEQFTAAAKNGSVMWQDVFSFDNQWLVQHGYLDERTNQLKEEEIRIKTEELEEAIETQERQYENLKLRIQYMYEKPQDSLFGLFLQDFSMIEILNRVDNTVKIQEYDRQKLEEYTANAEALDLQKQELEAAKKELEGLIEESKAQQAKVSALQKQTSATISDYLNQIAAAEEEIGDTEAALEAKSKALQALYKKAQEEEAAERRRQAEEAAKRLQEAIANGTIKPGDSGIVYGNLNLSQTELDMLTAMIYCEARGESYEGQLAVGYVIMNRVRSTQFPNNLEQVLSAPRQFEPYGSGRFNIVLTAYWEKIPGVISQSEWDSCQKAALVCVNSESNVGESLFFRTHKPVPQLIESLEILKEAFDVPYWIIGNHVFYYQWVNY